MTDTEEIWKPVKGYEEHYLVSNMGRVKSVERVLPFSYATGGKRIHNGKLKVATPHYKNKYLSVMLKVQGVEKRVLLHRLVAEHFLPNPEGKQEVNHIRGDKNDNRASSLEWVTPLENVAHSIATGLTIAGDAVFIVKDMAIMEFRSKRECSFYLGVSDSWVGTCIEENRLIKGYNVYAL